MIIYSTKELKPKLIEMWKLCFEDSDEFVQFYFDKVYQDNNTLVLLADNSIPVASLQILPYQIKIGEKIYNAGYISGAMTHPEHRKKGYMAQLLKAAAKQMKKQGFIFSFLIPQEEWLFDFYVKYGYEKAFPMTTENVNPANIHAESERVEVYADFENLPLEQIYHLYSGFLTQKENVVLKTKEQFCFILEDLFIDEGYIFYLKENGIAFVVEDEDESNAIFIKEILYTSNNCKQFLLSVIGKFFQTNKLTIENTQPSENSNLYGMIKVLDKSYAKIIPENIYMNTM